ncbi:MAG: hypothetical protein OEZ28_12840 [Nitrospinota bacterium]|nr:hypothetical protein [Nitrospinota bacterium]
MNTKPFHAIALTITLALAGASWADEKKVVILQVNDVYKTFPIMPENLGGFARLKTLVDTAKLDALRMRINESGKEGQFLWLNSNVRVEGKLLPGTVESIVLDINGVKVGFFGILGPDTHPSSIHKCTAKGGTIFGGYEKEI